MQSNQTILNPSRIAIVRYLMHTTGLCWAAADAQIQEMIDAGEVVETDEGEMEVCG